MTNSHVPDRWSHYLCDCCCPTDICVSLRHLCAVNCIHNLNLERVWRIPKFTFLFKILYPVPRILVPLLPVWRHKLSSRWRQVCLNSTVCSSFAFLNSDRKDCFLSSGNAAIPQCAVSVQCWDLAYLYHVGWVSVTGQNYVIDTASKMDPVALIAQRIAAMGRVLYVKKPRKWNIGGGSLLDPNFKRPLQWLSCKSSLRGMRYNFGPGDWAQFCIVRFRHTARHLSSLIWSMRTLANEWGWGSLLSTHNWQLRFFQCCWINVHLSCSSYKCKDCNSSHLSWYKWRDEF